jgi:hypothetical protein
MREQNRMFTVVMPAQQLQCVNIRTADCSALKILTKLSTKVLKTDWRDLLGYSQECVESSLDNALGVSGSPGSHV